MNKLLSALLLVGLLGCDGDDENDGPNPQAVKKCENFERVVCSRMISCVPTGAPSAGACVAELELEMAKNGKACSTAVGITASYDTCISKLTTWPCASLLGGSMPGECIGAILLPPPK